jgi:hypothetical protein
MATIISKTHAYDRFWFGFESSNLLVDGFPVIFPVEVSEEIYNKYQEHDYISL